MQTKKKPKPKKKVLPQKERFIETARKIGCDESEAAFDEKLRRIIPPKKGG